MKIELPQSLRTAKGELRYKDAVRNDIAKLEGTELESKALEGFTPLKLLPNEYPYDAFHKQNDMLVDTVGDFKSFWYKLGLMIEAGELDEYDQILINAPRRQSQKHVAHVHLLKFKDKREENRL